MLASVGISFPEQSFIDRRRDAFDYFGVDITDASLEDEDDGEDESVEFLYAV